MAEPFFKISSFLGTDNASDPAKVQPLRNGGLYFRELLNVDVDDEGMVHRRPGHADEPVANGSAIHSLWSDGETALFIQGTTLMKLNKNLSTSILVTGIDPTDRMAYVAVNDKVFFSNNSIIGYVHQGLPYPFPEPNQTFKIRMVGGQFLEFYNSRLYAANDANLFYSDATVLSRMDRRKNAKAFPGRITMLKATMDGLYVSADNKTYFLKGGDPDDFSLVQVLDEGVIEGSAIAVDGDEMGRGASGRTVYFLTPSGPYKGFPGGIVVERQGGLFGLDEDVDRATAILKTDNGYQQYVAIYQLRAGVGGADGQFCIPPTIVSAE